MNTGYILPYFKHTHKIHSCNLHNITFVCLITYVLWYMQILYRWPRPKYVIWDAILGSVRRLMPVIKYKYKDTETLLEKKSYNATYKVKSF